MPNSDPPPPDRPNPPQPDAPSRRGLGDNKQRARSSDRTGQSKSEAEKTPVKCFGKKEYVTPGKRKNPGVLRFERRNRDRIRRDKLIASLGQWIAGGASIAEIVERLTKRSKSPGYNDGLPVDKSSKNAIINILSNNKISEIVSKQQEDILAGSPPRFAAALEGLFAVLNAETSRTPSETLETSRYEERGQKFEELNHSFRREMASQLQPILNAHIQAMPHNTHEEKKVVAKWVNEELRRFDLAIKCPKTGQPSSLLAGPGNHPEIGRFMLEHKTPEGKRVRPVQTPELPHLELMEAAPRREAILEWQEKVGPQRGGAKRE